MIFFEQDTSIDRWKERFNDIKKFLQQKCKHTAIPIEIYVFSSDTAWANYEGIQADIFDHVFAILPAFDLCAHEAPTGNDIRRLALRADDTK